MVKLNQIIFGIACVSLGVILDRVFLRQKLVHDPPQSLLNVESQSSNTIRTNNDRRRLRTEFDDPRSVEARSDLPLSINSLFEPDQPVMETDLMTDMNTVFSQRDVHVGTMCRCPSNQFPAPGGMSVIGFDTTIVQPPSMATGPDAKHYIMHPPPPDGEGCTCIANPDIAERSYDKDLSKLKRSCPDKSEKFTWDAMPDLGVEERLPLFAGVLSFDSPLSLNATLHNWRETKMFEVANAQEVFVQMNHMSQADEDVIKTHAQLFKEDNQPPITPMGSPQENLHPGLTIAKFCRAAEAHPKGHPNGENLLFFVEKDWQTVERMTNEGRDIFNSINALVQRGVHFIRLQTPRISKQGLAEMWNCPSQGYAWKCSTAHQHRWTNPPSVIDCKWFLRYLEPFALLDDPIMYGCRPQMQEIGYSDWEVAALDGRVAWTNSQWVIAHLHSKPKLFNHHEVDQ